MGENFLTAEETGTFRRALLRWFDQHKRDLPWRRTHDAYAIWVSEIMLQQTRVAAVLDHYARWMERFPTVGALAAAEEPAVLALWSGLGYYRRARYLHAGARAVVAEHGGELPRTALALRSLPGIGEYTSAAIASIAFGETVAVVDGNVERVVMRLAGLAAGVPTPRASSDVGIAQGQAEQSVPAPRVMAAAPRVLEAAQLAREIRFVANTLIESARPGDFNQAMMELGATVCLPRAPLCLHCPVQPWCRTRGEHVAVPRKAMQSRSIAYALVERERVDGEREVLLEQRAAGASLMGGMWELPELPRMPGRAGEAIGEGVGTSPRVCLKLRHAITVTNYEVTVLACAEGELSSVPGEVRRWVPVAELPEMALTGLARKALRRMALWPVAILAGR